MELYCVRLPPLPRWKKNSIAYRLTFLVILFSTMVAILATALQLYLDYRRDIQGIYTFFDSIQETSIRPLEESVWILDDFQVNLQLEGLIKRENVVFAAVEMDGQMAWAKGERTPNDSLSHIFPLHHLVRGSSEQIGRLHVTASLEGIHQRLLQRIVILLASNAVKTFVVAGFILFLFQQSLTQHLVRLALYAEEIDPKKGPLAPLRLDRPSSHRADELDQVTTALNFLCESGHRALLEMEAQEQRLRLFLDATEEVILGVDAQGRCTFINRAGLEHFSGTDSNSFIGQDILVLLSSGERETAQSQLLSGLVRATIAEGEALLADEMPLSLPDGSSLLISLRSYPVLENGQCTGAVVFYADISRQQKLEQEKQLFAKVIRQAPALILIADAQGIIEYVNSAFEQILGYTGKELVGKLAISCLQDLHLDEHIDLVRTRIYKGEAWTGTFTNTNLQGRRVILEASIFPIFNRRGQLTNVVAMGRDITREQHLIEQLHHAQKMEAIGKLAASIAHEFGNPLLGIRFALRDVQQRLAEDSEDKKLLHLAENECDRMRKLIRDLQQFNRPSTRQRTVFDLHCILEDILTLNHNFLSKKKITLNRVYDHRALWVSAVEDQIRQVFINLTINAADAMAQKGGTLTIKTALRGNEAKVWVEDSGTGIAPENVGRIFEPFFTTKAAVEGAGLGLPVSYGIVRAHGGTIEVQSEPGKTIFSVTLPTAPIPVAGDEARGT
ncbi:PAS domain S-box protein [uncultured Desulfobulbus sp.]|uniref:PAS domain S-box protein n=1 Tax=uncultured Desulfobulbus sp. TaxID=239745 RepID=UPI00374D8FD5